MVEFIKAQLKNSNPGKAHGHHWTLIIPGQPLRLPWKLSDEPDKTGIIRI
ncbi:MAG: hypothetical protein LBP83_01455 [Dysgonamonadaceae bacterium]|nr:hypothetical protein [Dysgonamonadaceae bacterium]